MPKMFLAIFLNKNYHGFSMLLTLKILVCSIHVVLPSFLSCRKFFLPVNFISKATGNKNKKKISESRILGIIRLSTHVSFIHSQSIFVAKKSENNPAIPMIKATVNDHCHLVIRKTTIKPTVIVKTVFMGFDFVFITCYITFLSLSSLQCLLIVFGT